MMLNFSTEVFVTGPAGKITYASKNYVPLSWINWIDYRVQIIQTSSQTVAGALLYFTRTTFCRKFILR